ncbi:MAG: sulfatase [Planctomycetota bacterium]
MNRRDVALWSLLILTSLTASCGDEEPASTDVGTGPPNVVIFLMDTMRADRLSVYGYDRPTSPRMEELAEEAIVFESAHAPAPWTLPSVASLMLSSFLSEHGVVRDGDTIPGSAAPLAERLRSAGYRTASFHRNPYAGKLSGLDRGFEISELVEEEIDGELVGRWLEDASGEEPFFLYCHNTGAHDPYDPPAEYLAPFGSVDRETIDRITEICHEYRQLTRENIVALLSEDAPDNSARQAELMKQLAELEPTIDLLYDAEVLWADALLGDVIDSLKERGVWDDTLFIVLSDHGEELGEHAGWQHDQSTYEELVRVPLIVKLPNGLRGGTRISAPTTTIDVMPTVLDFTGLDPEEAVSGRSLETWLLGLEDPSEDVRVTSVRLNRKKYYAPNKALRGDENIVVRQGRFKGILNSEVDTFELYDLEADPGEQTDLSPREPERTAKLRSFAKAWRALAVQRMRAGYQADVQVALDPEQRRLLESLGYLTAPKK